MLSGDSTLAEGLKHTDPSARSHNLAAEVEEEEAEEEEVEEHAYYSGGLNITKPLPTALAPRLVLLVTARGRVFVVTACLSEESL